MRRLPVAVGSLLVAIENPGLPRVWLTPSRWSDYEARLPLGSTYCLGQGILLTLPRVEKVVEEA